ncbi:MAG TPA: anti-sigma factor antagonist [Methylothermaceae bacterium]|nr:anti-sigma factor antagonist [Methylothermaceae bacterium]
MSDVCQSGVAHVTMELVQGREGNTLVLQPSGRLDATTAPDLEAHYHAMEGEEAVILDCTGLDYVSSAGLRVVLVLAKGCLAASRPFLVCGLQPQVEEIFRLAGFHHILAIRRDLGEALADIQAS